MFERFLSKNPNAPEWFQCSYVQCEEHEETCRVQIAEKQPVVILQFDHKHTLPAAMIRDQIATIHAEAFAGDMHHGGSSSTDLLALPRHTLLVATTEGYQKYEINVLGYLLLRFNSVAVCVEQLAVLRSIGSALMVWMFNIFFICILPQ